MQELAAQKNRPLSNSPHMLMAGITLALCGVVFGVWEMRENYRLRQENSQLRASRMGLINSLHDRNQQSGIPAQQTNPDILIDSAVVDETLDRPLHHSSGESALQPLAGFPLSFDNGSVDKPLLCLTFDGGSESNAAPEILDTLQSRNVKATMFLTGAFIRRYPDLVRRIVDQGHEVGNHTNSHPHLTSMADTRTQETLPEISTEVLRKELWVTDQAFLSATGNHMAPLWRAPYGEANREIYIWAQQAGFIHIGWRQGKTWRQNFDSNDWVAKEEDPGYHSPQDVLDKFIGLANENPSGLNGGIILMHLGTERTSKDQQVHHILGRLIDELQARGYRFVKVTEMLKEAGVEVGGMGKENR